MFQELESQLYFGFLLLTVAFAWWKGGRAERIGSLFNAILCISAVMVHAATRGTYGTAPILIFDGLLATGFLILAFRYASLWLASAMVLQSATFLIHAALLMGVLPEGNPPHFYYYMTMNLLGSGVMAAILVGTAAAWRQRVRANAVAA
ncbi:MAG TPA: hypothetical protein VD906_14815 [Caulobacteraceae bacterium]|nr:hypothetical protein [Caulobacteraceae bacterium]